MDSNIIIAVGNVGTVVRSSNNGFNWTVISPITPQNLRYISSTRTNLLYAVGDNGIVIKSTNTGLNWNVVNLNYTRYFTYITFKDSVGIITSDSGNIFRSSDYGNTWIKMYLGVNAVYTSAYVTQTSSYLTSVSLTEYIKKSTNFGLNWFNHTVIINQPQLKMEFYDNAYGYFNTPYRIYITTNGGGSWSYYYDNLSISQTSFDIANILTVFVTTENSTFLKTTNAGLNWNFVPIAITKLNDIEFYKPIITSIANNAVEIFTFKINNIYPNPFNPVTNISFQIPSKDYVNIVVYDINGKLVDKLYNGFMNAGEHTLTWDARIFSSGVYFVRFNYKNNIQFKMVSLIK